MHKVYSSVAFALPLALTLVSGVDGARADTVSAVSFNYNTPAAPGLTNFVTFTNQRNSVFGTGLNPLGTEFYAGAIQLVNVTSNPTSLVTQNSNIIAFCVELTQNLATPATWEAIARFGIIGGLITEYLATSSVSVSGVTYSDADDLGAAFQIAIWSQVYSVGGPLTYSVNAALLNSTGGAKTNSNFHDLVDKITADAIGTDWRHLVLPFGDNRKIDQDLAILPNNPAIGAPGPLAGAGVPGLLAACAGLFLLARRRRQKLA